MNVDADKWMALQAIHGVVHSVSIGTKYTWFGSGYLGNIMGRGRSVSTTTSDRWSTLMFPYVPIVQQTGGRAQGDQHCWL